MIDTLRKMHPNNHQAVLDMVISHQGLPHKIELVKRILSTLVLPAPVPYRSLLRRFAALSSKGTADVAVRARQLLVSLFGRVVLTARSCACEWLPPLTCMPARVQRASPRACLRGVHSRSLPVLLLAGSEPAG